MMTKRDLWIVIFSTLAPIISGIILHFIFLLPLPFIVIICILAILFPSWFDQYFRSRNLERRVTSMESRLGALVNMVKLVIDALMGVRIKLSQLRRDKPITAGDFTDIFDEATSAISGGIMDAYFKTIGTRSSNPSYEEERKRELLEKAKRREISQEEGEELRRLLERQKREREAAGDILGAIMLGLLILFIIGVVAALFGRRD